MSGLEEAVLRNISAVGELSEIVRTSFGPNGELTWTPPRPEEHELISRPEQAHHQSLGPPICHFRRSDHHPGD